MFERFPGFVSRMHRRDFEDDMSRRVELSHGAVYRKSSFSSGIYQAEAARRARLVRQPNPIEGDCREARGLHLFGEFVASRVTPCACFARPRDSPYTAP